MEPSRKSYSLEQAINAFIGADRSETIRSNKCIPPPIGCGQVITGFRDAVSEKEYTISGLCQACQDKVFGA